uniref:Uncharacterized protein n=1 Tax=Oryza nivara TaxID=4536 RepID=A0A0E0H8Y9_ORYNI
MLVVVRLDVPEELVEVAPLELLAAEAVAIAGGGVMKTMVRADGDELGRVRLLHVDGAHLLRDSPQTARRRSIVRPEFEMACSPAAIGVMVVRQLHKIKEEASSLAYSILFGWQMDVSSDQCKL